MPSKTNDAQQILIIDDDPDIVQTIKGNLELDGFEVFSAHSGRQGLDRIRDRRPDLIILDLGLPDIDGIKCCQFIRREYDLPIIMLTARDSVADMVLGLECGADDYMVKPFNALELSARIRALLKRMARSLVQNRYECGPLAIDYVQRRVSLRGREIPLTKTEYELLELFVSYPNQVLARDFIRGQIWRDAQLYGHSRTLDVHVQRLRKKIETDPQNPCFIVTIAGVGYKYMGRADQRTVSE
jgi:two-component system alkaline phosphatase synthesis response regulator PhoP/OmpR family response regulator RpaB